MKDYQTLKNKLRDLIREYDEEGEVELLLLMVAEIEKNDPNHQSDYSELKNRLLGIDYNSSMADNAITSIWLLSVSDEVPAEARSIIGQAADQIQIWFDRESLKI